MTCTEQCFLGSAIKNFNCNVGYNGQISSISVNVVDDPDSTTCNDFDPPLPGTPVFFKFTEDEFTFTFGGVLQGWTEVKNINNFPSYEVTVNDAREVLSTIQLILGGYNQTVSIENLFNVYGYLESIAFGGANVNEGGMAWNSILGALAALGTGPTLWSGGINVQGYRYHIDLSEVPIVPIYFRIPGQSVSLLEVIDFICTETGHDYYIDLEEGTETSHLGTLIHTIKIRTVSRRVQPNIGAIEQFVTENCLTVTELNKGLEFRNEVTSAFLVGAQQDVLIEVDQSSSTPENEAIWPYWGLNAIGNAIISDIDYRNDDDTKTVTVDARILNAAGIGDSYTMTLGEIRSALSGFDAWSSYVSAAEPFKAALLGLEPVWGKLDLQRLKKLVEGNLLQQDFINWKREAAIQRGQRLIDEITLKSQFNVFQFVSNYASEFYGRKFMVRIPSILGYFQPETGIGITSLEPTDSGWPNDVSGENIINNLGPLKPFFTNEQGKLECFVRFDNLDLNNVELLNGHTSENLIKWGDYIFIRCQIDPILVYGNVSTLDSPRAVITLAAPLLHRIEDDGFPVHMKGLLKIMEEALRNFWLDPVSQLVVENKGQPNQTNTALTPENYIKSKRTEILKSLSRMAGGQVFTGLADRPYLPNKALVPLRSNILTYGPWYVTGVPGKVDFEKDDSLTPWNYGGLTLLNTVGAAKIADKLTGMTHGELGSITFVGAPKHNLGDVLLAGGPNITGITCQVSEQGTLTTYRLRTYTPKLGSANKALIDRIQRLTKRFQDYDRNMRTQAFINKVGQGGGAYFNYRRNFIMNSNGPIGIKKGSPPDFIAAVTIADSSNFVSAAASFMSGPEALMAANADNAEEYKKTSIMSTGGIFRGFSTDVSTSGIPHFVTPSSVPINATNLNPFSNTDSKIDIDYLAHGDTYPVNGINTEESYDPNTARPVGLRGPLVVAGWGYNQYGGPVPSSSPSEFLSDYKHKSDMWPVGPVDLRWDEYRKVWAGYVCHTARANGTLTRGSSGNFDVYTGPGGNNMFKTGRNVWAWDWMLASGQTISSGQKCILMYNGWDLFVVSAECTATSGSVLFPGG